MTQPQSSPERQTVLLLDLAGWSSDDSWPLPAASTVALAEQ